MLITTAGAAAIGSGKADASLGLVYTQEDSVGRDVCDKIDTQALDTVRAGGQQDHSRVMNAANVGSLAAR